MVQKLPKTQRQNLARLGDELRFVMITSEARVNPLEERPDSAIAAKLANGDSLYIEADASSHQKCVRCWHHRADVGSDASHPDLCGRCVENVSGDGEPRQFA